MKGKTKLSEDGPPQFAQLRLVSPSFSLHHTFHSTFFSSGIFIPLKFIEGQRSHFYESESHLA